MGEMRARDGAMAVCTPRPLALLHISQNVGENKAVPMHPRHHGLQGSEPSCATPGSPVRVCNCYNQDPASLPLGGEN